MKLPTDKFSMLLTDAKAWDSRYSAMCRAQTEFLLTSFAFGDGECIFIAERNREAWDVPRVAIGPHRSCCPYTICE